jgi:predicted AAA+ superfamily ATPase
MLRYLFEEMPWLPVIVAGSLLESMLAKKISFPVGSVEFLPVRPCSFAGFLVRQAITKVWN